MARTVLGASLVKIRTPRVGKVRVGKGKRIRLGFKKPRIRGLKGFRRRRKLY